VSQNIDIDVQFKDIKFILDSALNTLMETVASGEKIKLTGFGTFSSQTYRKKKVRNPRNPSEMMEVPEHVIPKFRAGKEFKDIVAGRVEIEKEN
jgi:DNA-binding protein HU-beta